MTKINKDEVLSAATKMIEAGIGSVTVRDWLWQNHQIGQRDANEAIAKAEVPERKREIRVRGRRTKEGRRLGEVK